MKWLKRTLLALASVVVLGLVVLFFAHPWLAITERSGGMVLVVEGWMDDEAIQKAARLFTSGGYERIYTTGTTRPFAYYLAPGERLEISGLPNTTKSFEIGLAGLPACSAVVKTGADTLLFVPMTDRITTHGVDRNVALGDLCIIADPQYPQPGPPAVFIHALRFDGINAHEVGAVIRIVSPDSSSRRGEPTYADQSAAILHGTGIPNALITPVPAGGDPISRSWANASTLAFHLNGKGITALDVVTLGVHARRSRALYREALGENVAVGVISIPDPDCPADGWWKSKKGWYFMLKELVGSQEARAVEVVR